MVTLYIESDLGNYLNDWRLYVIHRRVLNCGWMAHVNQDWSPMRLIARLNNRSPKGGEIDCSTSVYN